MADGYLTFDTKMNTSGFKAGLGQLTSMFGKLAAVAGVALSVNALIQFGKAGVQAASEMGAKFKGLEFLMRANNRNMQDATAFIQQFTADGLVPMTSAYEAYKNMVSRGYDTSQIEQMMTVMKDAAVYARQGQFSMGEAIEKTTMGLRMENSLLTDSVGIQANVAKMWQEYAREIGTTANNLTMAQKRQAEFNGFMREGGVFAGAAAGYMNTYAGRMAKLSASFLNLKVSVGNAIIPVINAILPYISAAIDYFTRLFNIVGRVMNLLFGTNVGMADAQAAMAKDAQATADATGQTVDNTERAGKAAKGALAAFDKLNVLQQESSEGGSGSARAADTALPGGEKVGGVAQEVDDLLQKLQEFYAKVKGLFEPGGAGSLAKSISDSIVGGLENARKSVQEFDFIGLGSDLANGFNKSIGVINELINNTDFSGIGSNLGGLIGAVFVGALDTGISFLQGVDWQNVGSTIWSGIQGALDFAWGFLEGVDWSGVVSKFFELLGSAFGAVAGIAVGLGTSIWESLKEAWATTKQKWEEFKDEAGGDIWGGIKSGIKKALENVGTWIKENIVDPFINGFKKSFGIASPSTVMAEQGVFLIDGLKKGIEDAWKGVEKWFTEKISDPIKKWFSDTWDDIKKGATSAWDNLVEAWGGAKTWFTEHVTDPIQKAFEDAWNKIGEFMENPFEAIGTFVKDKLNGIIDFLNGLLRGVADGVNNTVGLINSISFKAPKWAVDWFGAPETIGFNLPSVSARQIPYLATGAVIPPNAPFAAVMGDQRSGRNLEAPESLIRQIVREESGGMGGQNITITFGGTMGELVRQLKPHIERETSRVGGNLMAKVVRV